MTLTLAAVYAPIAFAPGRTGRLFLEFALTLAGAVMVSGFVALTLTPMMCSQAAASTIPSPAASSRVIERGFTAFENGYRALLGGVAARRAAGRRWSRWSSPALSGAVLHAAARPSWRRSRTAA